MDDITVGTAVGSTDLVGADSYTRELRYFVIQQAIAYLCSKGDSDRSPIELAAEIENYILNGAPKGQDAAKAEK